jgi:hypothetical protein
MPIGVSLTVFSRINCSELNLIQETMRQGKPGCRCMYIECSPRVIEVSSVLDDKPIACPLLPYSVQRSPWLQQSP